MEDGYLRDVLSRLDPGARDAVRQVLIAVDAYRDEMARRLLRERTEHADNPRGPHRRWTGMHVVVVRLLGELEAT